MAEVASQLRQQQQHQHQRQQRKQHRHQRQQQQPHHIQRPGVKYCKTAPSVERLLPRILRTSPAKRCKPWSNWHRALSERQPRQGVTYVPRHGATR